MVRGQDVFTLSLLWLLGSVAWAEAVSANQGKPIDHAKQYKACITLTRVAPLEALESALAWADRGGGRAALHCEALSLIKLGHYEAAAQRLEAVALDVSKDEKALRINVWGQAGQAWLLAGKPDRALAAQSLAIDQDPENIEMLLDRSLTHAETGNYEEAVIDLNRAASLAPDRADILVFRASAYRHLKSFERAMADAEQALRLQPSHPEGLLERGNLHRIVGNSAAAQRDWQDVIRVAPGSMAAKSAERNLARLQQ